LFVAVHAFRSTDPDWRLTMYKIDKKKFFLVVCSDMVSKGIGLVAFFASVKTSSVCIYLSCLVCIQSVVHGVRSRLFCSHEGCSVPEVSITSFLPLHFFVSVRLSESNLLTHIKNVGKTKVLYIFKIVSVLTFLKIILLIIPINCRNFANLNSKLLEKL
jgi:low affinity Fe/Cu permease